MADPLSGFFMAPAINLARSICPLSGFKILLDILLLPPRRNLRVKEFPNTLRDRELGTSKLDAAAWDFFRLLRAKWVGRCR